MDSRRVERTLVHKKFGIFRYSSELEKHGIVAPSEQIVAIGRFIEEGLGRATKLPRLSDREALEQWMSRTIAEVIGHWRKAPYELEPLELLALRAGIFVAWNPYIDFSELLNVRCGDKAYALAASRLRARGFDVNLPDLSVLAEQFLLFYLPRAIRSFDPRRSKGREAAWLATVFYRFALSHLISDQKNRRHLELLRPKGGAKTTPEETLEERTRQGALTALPMVLEQLPSRERLALKRYFGFGGREYTLAEVAGELGVSEYLARTAIIRGLATLAALLGVQGPLDEQEFTLLRLLFVEGMALQAAAKQLQIDSKQAHHLAARIMHKFRQGLRSRTTIASPHPRMPRKEKTMDNALLLSDEQIITELKDLRETPSLHMAPEGELLAEIAATRVPVSRIRKIVERSEVLQSLQDRQLPLDWLAVPDATLERADLPEDASEWANAIQELGQRSWVTAEVLYHRCCEETEAKQGVFVDEEGDQTVERIHRTLAGIAQAIEMALPLNIRRKGSARFRMDWQEDDQVLGSWEGVSNGQRLDLRELAGACAESLGEIPSQSVNVFADVFVREFFAGDITLPGFRRAQESTARTVWLEWHPPKINGGHLARTSRD